jgi:hypothetical protein
MVSTGILIVEKIRFGQRFFGIIELIHLNQTKGER